MHWRNAADPLTIIGVDIRCLCPIFIWLYFPGWITFGIALTASIFFIVLSVRGTSLIVFLRWLRHRIRGKVLDPEGWLIWRRYRSK